MMFVTADIETLGPIRSVHVFAALAMGSKGSAGAVTCELIAAP